MSQPGPFPGARVQVTWTDGHVYPGSVVQVSQGYAHVRWDAGGAPSWVPLHAIAPLAGAPPPSSAVPVGWSAEPQSAPLPRAPEARKALPTKFQEGAPPRPMSGKIRDLPRGLVYQPTGRGPGDGRAFFLFFGFVATADVDLFMRANELDHLGDDVAALRAAGFRVIVDLHGDLEGLGAALAATHPDALGLPAAGIYWSGHGDDDGTIGSHDGAWIAPEQLAADAAKKGGPKLFVMCACHAGAHTPRWQKALGPETQIIGWGAPITIQKAIEFLVPDDANAKGLDDLLEKHLGVRRVGADGPLAEARDLARQHEERLSTLLLGVEELVLEAQKRLKARLDKGKTGETFFLEVRTPASKDFPNQPRSQVVRVAGMGAGDAWVHVSSIVGPHSDALDLARGLRAVSGALNVRMALVKMSPPDQEFLLVETLLRRRRLDPHSFASSVVSVAAAGDRLEDLFFGSDKR
jgi:hypothetical protein